MEIGRRFLIVGETGVGKTTTANHLSGENNKVSDLAVGVTLDYHSVFRGETELVDTVGLSEGSSGSVHPAVAFAKLVQFAKANGKGFNGMFVIVAGPRVTSTMEENYKLFVNNVVQDKAPCFLFINKQELEDDYKTQYERNKDQYQRAGLKFTDGFAGGWKTEEAREWTFQCFDRCIYDSPSERVKLYSEATFLTYVKRLWRDICTFWSSTLNFDYEEPLDDTIEGVLRKLGSPKKLAREFANKIESGSINNHIIQDFSSKLKKDAALKQDVS